MFKNIVVPIDLDQLGKAADMLGLASSLADEGAKVTVVNVVEEVPGFISAELPGGLIEKSADNAQKILEDRVKSAGLSADVQIRKGRAHHAIVSLADDLGADLILIASHRPELKDYLLGSTAASVVRHAKCAVLVHR